LQEGAIAKNFDVGKLTRFFTFVKHFVALPHDLELVFKGFEKQLKQVREMSKEKGIFDDLVKEAR
jgi:hypothetical protein